MSSNNKPVPLKGLFALLSLISLFSITLSFQNCSPAKFGSQLSASFNGLDTVGLGNACSTGTVAVGVDVDGSFICEPMVNLTGTSCPANSFVYSYNSSTGQLTCLSLNGRQSPPNQYCEPGYYLVSVSANGALICQSTPGATPNTCAADSYPIGVLGNGSIICSNTPISNIHCAEGMHLTGVDTGGKAICETLPQIVAEAKTCASGEALIGLDGNGDAVCQDLFDTNKPNETCSVGSNAQGLASSGLNLDCQALPVIDLSHACPVGSYPKTVTSGELDCMPLSSNQVFNGTCPAGQYLLGFNAGQPVCEDMSLGSLPAFCPAGTHASGISSGAIVCRVNPLITPICVPNSTQSCFVYDGQQQVIGTGTQTCDSAGSAWGTCLATACDTTKGYSATPVNGVCQTQTVTCPAGMQMVGGQCVDNLDPVVQITKKPADSKDRNPTVEFTATDHGRNLAKVECLLDGNLLASCTSPLQLSNLPLGQRNIVVRATDQANRVASATHTWSVLACSRAAEDKTSCNIANGTGVNYCKADGSGYESACTALTCNAGFTKRGNTCVDATPPTIQVSKSGSDSSPRFNFTVTDSGSGVASRSCSLVRTAGPGQYQSSDNNCSSPKAYNSLGYGSYSFTVSAVDNASNRATSQPIAFNNYACSAGQSKSCSVTDDFGNVAGNGKNFCSADRFSYKSSCEQIECLGGYKLEGGKCVLDAFTMGQFYSPKHDDHMVSFNIADENRRIIQQVGSSYIYSNAPLAIDRQFSFIKYDSNKPAKFKNAKLLYRCYNNKADHGVWDHRGCNFSQHSDILEGNGIGYISSTRWGPFTRPLYLCQKSSDSKLRYDNCNGNGFRVKKLLGYALNPLGNSTNVSSCATGYRLQNGICVLRGSWVNVSYNVRLSSTSDVHAALCASKGYAKAANQGKGICESSETRNNSRNGAISSKTGSILKYSASRFGGATHCYASGQKQDYDSSDRVLKVLCDTETRVTVPPSNPPYSGGGSSGGGSGGGADTFRTIEN